MPTDKTDDFKIPSLKLNKIVEKELRIELLDYNATLTQTSVHALIDGASSYTHTEELLREARVIATIPTGLETLWHLACIGADEAWVSGWYVSISRISKIHPNTDDDVFTVCRLFPTGLSSTKEGELMYSDWHSRSIYVVRNEKTEKLITVPTGWFPDRLCCTRSGDILVSLSKKDHKKPQKVICYQGQRVKLEVEKDEHGDLIFAAGSNSLYVAGNNNGDICVSDANAQRVIVLDKTGRRVRFIYDGSPVTSRTLSFGPHHIVTDSLSQIIVAEPGVGCIHIIDQNGYFLRFVEKTNLSYINGLSIDSKKRLWIANGETKEVMIFQYLN
ncbi:uncharacterized protein LOC134234112 [Saccostrea cucullata]|uniref:uncharacterized protein LOC134234112 n=1 Tax=Saccostrea cuccullata TaxID=36930 RepID=UPI002ED02827